MQTVEAIIDAKGMVKIIGDVRLPRNRRALITILDDQPRDSADTRKEKLFVAIKKLAENDIESNFLIYVSRGQILRSSGLRTTATGFSF